MSKLDTSVRAAPDIRLMRHGDPPISADALAQDLTPGASLTNVAEGSERSAGGWPTAGDEDTSAVQDRAQSRSGLNK